MYTILVRDRVKRVGINNANASRVRRGETKKTKRIISFILFCVHAARFNYAPERL